MDKEILKTGITTLGDNTSSGEARQHPEACDYLFVHGLNGDAKASWTDEKTGFYWPWQLLLDLPGARVGVFAYLAQLLSWSKDDITIAGLSSQLRTALISWRRHCDNRPLVIIAHSLGGLVVKQALFDIHSARHGGAPVSDNRMVLNKTLDSLAGLVFFGVPHLGSKVEDKKRVKILKSVAGTVLSSPKGLTEALRQESQHLSTLCDNFENTPLFNGEQVQFHSYYETVEEKKVGEVVVPRESTRMHARGESHVAISKSHTQMAKFENEKDARYQDMKDIITSIRNEGIKRQRQNPGP